MPEPITIDKSIVGKKGDLLSYFRYRAAEAITEISEEHGKRASAECAKAINNFLSQEKESLLAQIRQRAVRERWEPKQIIDCMLLVSHCCNVVMLESRHSVRPYEYMDFSRRIGELWEPFCNICFEVPVRSDVSLFTPPLFKDVRDRLHREIRDYIAGLPLSQSQKKALLEYYDKVWTLVDAGEIKLSLDLHFAVGTKRCVVDFKSGFGSNEKGNTNRLLLVASVYMNIEPEEYQCILLVRSAEDENNNYLQTLKASGLWEVYCGPHAYERVREYSGYDIKTWIDKNIDWPSDLNPDFLQYLKDNKLEKYLAW